MIRMCYYHLHTIAKTGIHPKREFSFPNSTYKVSTRLVGTAHVARQVAFLCTRSIIVWISLLSHKSGHPTQNQFRPKVLACVLYLMQLWTVFELTSKAAHKNQMDEVLLCEIVCKIRSGQVFLTPSLPTAQYTKYFIVW